MASELQSIALKTIDGQDSSLGAYAGKVLLIVNTASKCGLTPQYEGLEALYSKYKDKGLVVLGFPANNFAGQEPGSDAEIQEFCTTKFSVDFPLFSKISVAGSDKHPLYAALTAAQPKAEGTDTFRERLKGYGMTPNAEPEVLWNFEKFLVGKDGKVIGRFSPDMGPTDERLVGAIEGALAA
ncbi:glutathione peroxidase [Zavarzinia sp. CC-PAN008]|uniref:glutathione peroxidase n=1 Tax=Zavarzinia sp. CC-PAN008 TaxID=3243332 RepID=UPI003F74508A